MGFDALDLALVASTAAVGLGYFYLNRSKKVETSTKEKLADFRFKSFDTVLPWEYPAIP
jgi:hypothetical protein